MHCDTKLVHSTPQWSRPEIGRLYAVFYSRGQKCRTTLSNTDENTITLIHSLIKKDIGLIKKDIGMLR